MVVETLQRSVWLLGETIHPGEDAAAQRLYNHWAARQAKMADTRVGHYLGTLF
jgi:hypothetical protein